MARLKMMMLALGAGLLLLGALGACVMEGEAADVDATSGAGVGTGANAALAASLASGAPMSMSAALPGTVAAGESGIWVSGQGRMTMEPDLAVVNLGVEAIDMPLADANATAATAMDAIMTSLADNGVADNDIQTHSFNVSPQYEWVEVENNGRFSSRRELVGYRVTNGVTAKVRDMDSIGTLIDAVIAAGGDATRFNSLRFTVEDTSSLMDDLREAAVMDAMNKAQQMADTAGVTLGSLAYVTDSPVSSYGPTPVFRESAALAVADVSTPISGGELELSLSVHAAFAIE